ncbi:MAG TPA: hypothetical protein VFI73_07190 [Candidatus Nitrosopolaris sp.]|nr:hypothetical protein [Candidatus Nitrosopolaris sp.]
MLGSDAYLPSFSLLHFALPADERTYKAKLGARTRTIKIRYALKSRRLDKNIKNPVASPPLQAALFRA